MMAVNSVETNVVLKEGNWVDRILLIYENYVLAMSVGLRTRETKNTHVWVPQRSPKVRMDG